MTTNRTRRSRNQKEVIPLTDALTRMLLFREVERKTPDWSLYVSRFFDDGEKLRELWLEHKKELMKIWNQSGREGLPWVMEYLKSNEPWPDAGHFSDIHHARLMGC